MPTIEELYTRIGDLIDEIRSSRSGGTGQNVPILRMPDPAKMKEEGDKALKGLEEVGSKGLALASMFNVITGKKDAVLSALDAIAKGRGPKLAVGQLRLASGPNEQAVKSGASTEALGQRQNELATQVTYADLQKAMRESGTGLQGAGTLQADRLSNINETLTKLNSDQGNKGRFANGLTDADTLAKALIMSQQRTTLDLSKSGDQDRAVVNAGKLADVIGDTAARIGVDRETIANQTAERLKDGSVQATLTTLRTEEQRQAFIRSQASLTGFGKDVQDLAKDFVAFGGPTAKTMDTMVALGPAGRELGAAMADLKKATNEQERAAAEERLERAKGMINERQRDPRAARLAMAAEAFPEVKALQGFKRQFEQNREVQGYNYQRNRGETSEGAQKAIAAQQQMRQEGKGPSGEPLSADQKLQGLILEGNRVAAQGAAHWMGKLNEELNKSPEKIDAMVKAMKKMDRPVELNPSPNGDSDKNKGQYRAVKADGTRDIGTLGKTGQMFEPKDIVALLHKGERVLNPKENSDLTSLHEMISNLNPKGNAGTTEEVTNTATSSVSAEPEVAGTTDVTLKDLHDSLQRLNSTMEIMASHTADMKDTNRTTADMSQKMTGNRLAV